MSYNIYINKLGEEVEVSEQHLQTSLAIKLELQDSNPSRRCAWKKHKQMMEQEGFFDSEASENYRCMIKYYQTKNDLFNRTIDKSDDKIIAGRELDSIQALVGEIATEKRENQSVLRELNKARRKAIDNNLYTKAIIERVEEFLKDYKFPVSTNVKPIVANDGATAVALISDWHIGALVETKSNKFNYEVAKDRVRQYTEQLITHCVINNIKEVEIVFMGDLIEGSFMRASQGFDVEFNTAEQIGRASDLLMQLIVDVSEVAKVTYRAFSGNHDRVNQSDKGNNLHGDSVVVISNKIIETFVKGTKNPNIGYAQADHYSASLNINGVDIKLVHGDLEKRNDKNKIHAHSSRDAVSYRVLAYGHFHHFALTEIGHDRFELTVGSIKGTDDYAERFGLQSAPSQAILTISKDGYLDIKRIGLK